MGYICFSCEERHPFERRIFRCDCGGFLPVEGYEIFPQEELEGRDLTIWRYREAFGLPGDVEPVSLGEGFTPLLKREIDGTELYLKLDFMQPSGSFKDRGASVLISFVRWLGVTDVVEDSSGNAGAAISAYAAAAGLNCTVFVPDYTPEGKLTQIRLYGAKVVKVPGKRQDANEAAIRASKDTFYASHLWHPFFVMGLKSAAFEVWEALGKRVPPAVVVPVGSGGFCEGLFLGFKALAEAGYSEGVPRMIGVQAERCPPIHRAFAEGLDDHADVEVEITVAEGIAVQRPPRAKAVLKAIRESRGYTIGVEEEEIISALKVLFSMGLFVEPTSATVLAAWLKMAPEEREGAVLILTGSGLKETKKLGEIWLQGREGLS